MKKLVVIMLVFILCTIPCNASTELTVYVNGQNVLFDVPPIIVFDRTMVPIRMISERMGAIVEYDETNKLVYVISGDRSLILKIGSKYALLNNKLVSMDVSPLIINGRTLVPLRFVSESFDISVTYTDLTRRIDLSGSMDNNLSPILKMQNEQRTYSLTLPKPWALIDNEKLNYLINDNIDALIANPDINEKRLIGYNISTRTMILFSYVQGQAIIDNSEFTKEFIEKNKQELAQVIKSYNSGYEKTLQSISYINLDKKNAVMFFENIKDTNSQKELSMATILLFDHIYIYNITIISKREEEKTLFDAYSNLLTNLKIENLR